MNYQAGESREVCTPLVALCAHHTVGCPSMTYVRICACVAVGQTLLSYARGSILPQRHRRIFSLLPELLNAKCAAVAECPLSLVMRQKNKTLSARLARA